MPVVCAIVKLMQSHTGAYINAYHRIEIGQKSPVRLPAYKINKWIRPNRIEFNLRSSNKNYKTVELLILYMDLKHRRRSNNI